MNIGLTGGIATGKSTVAKLLTDRGALLIDLDRIAREVVSPGQSALGQIVQQFGQTILQPDGTLNRKQLGKIVFADPDRRKQLEAITHPAIRTVMQTRMQEFEQLYPDRLTVVDVPLLYESRLASYFSCVVVVYVPRAEQLRRLMERDKLTRKESEERLAAQMDIEEKRERANYVIDNSGSFEQTRQQVNQFWQELRPA